MKSELSGDFERVILALITPWPEYMAGEIHYAIQGAGTDEKKLVEILCPCSNQQMRQIGDAYQQLYGKSMESAVKSDLSGDLRRFMVAIMQVRYRSRVNLKSKVII